MSSDGGGKYGNLRVERGGKYGSPNRQPVTSAFTTLEFDLDRDMKDLFVALEAECGTVPSRAIQEVREGNQRPWRFLAKRFAEAIDAGTAVPSLFEITHRLNQYIAARAARRRAPNNGKAA